MTFKHIGFTDSSVMRSLERVAIEKGLVKPEVMTKSAEALVAKKDLSPTNNFSQDIIKLCNGLRRSGFNKHAEDIELHFAQYKKAQTLYETFKEKGEDLVESANPDGPHVFEDILGKPEVLDIVTRHSQILKTINKQPTGKLDKNASKKKIILAAKQLIDQSNPYIIRAKDHLQKAKELYQTIYDIVIEGKHLETNVKLVIEVNLYTTPLRTPSTLMGVSERDTDTSSILQLQYRINTEREKLKPGGSTDPDSILRKGVPVDTWQRAILPLFEKIDDLVGTSDSNGSGSDTAYNLALEAENQLSGKSESKDDDFDTDETSEDPSGRRVRTGSGKKGIPEEVDEGPETDRPVGSDSTKKPSRKNPDDVGEGPSNPPPPLPTHTPPPGSTGTSGRQKRTPEQEAQDPLYFDIYKIINRNIGKLRSYKAVEKVKKDPKLINWINHVIKYFKDIKESYAKVEDKQAVLNNLKRETQIGINSVRAFYDQHVKISS